LSKEGLILLYLLVVYYARSPAAPTSTTASVMASASSSTSSRTSRPSWTNWRRSIRWEKIFHAGYEADLTIVSELVTSSLDEPW